MELQRFLVGVFPFYGLLIQTIIPLFLLVIAVVRKRKQKQKEPNRDEHLDKRYILT